MNSEILTATRLIGKSEGSVIKSDVLPNEIEGVIIEYISVRGANQITEYPQPDQYYVLLSLKGEAQLNIRGGKNEFNSNFIVRIPYNEQFNLQVEKGKEFHYLSLRIQLNNSDLNLISQSPEEHSYLYIKALSDCPVYTEEIKSSKTTNRMILPVGLVQGFAWDLLKLPDLIQ